MEYLKVGYDRISVYTVEEIEKMLIDERGISKAEAEPLAKELFLEINKMNTAERYSWRKAFAKEVKGLDLEVVT